MPSPGWAAPSGSEGRNHSFVAAYCDAWKVKYGHSPDIAGKDAPTLVRLSKKQGIEEYCHRLERYLRDDDPFLVKLAHLPAQFEGRWNALAVNGNGAPRPAAPGFSRAGRPNFIPAPVTLHAPRGSEPGDEADT